LPPTVSPLQTRSQDLAGKQPHSEALDTTSVAVLIPCFNEEMTIEKVISDFRSALPVGTIYVYDNNSTDRTADRAISAGAIVRSHRVQGKGAVVRRMFADVEADVYVLVDGDDTYDATSASDLVVLMLDEKLDLINAARVSVDDRVYRYGHRFGNVAFTTLVRIIFGRELTDVLSGYKVLSRRFVKTFPASSTGFEIETELAVHCLDLEMPCVETPVHYRQRPRGSVSKLRTFRDGFRILLLIARLVKDERPLQFFSLIGLLAGAVGIGLGIPVIATYLKTGLVPRLPTAILALGLVILASLSVFTGTVLDVMTKTRREMKRLSYLSVSPPHRN
jgi:glycosyltransferase involved in cell wall biosynthesis